MLHWLPRSGLVSQDRSVFDGLCVAPHSILDVVVDDEVEFLLGEAVVAGKSVIDRVDYLFAFAWIDKLNSQRVVPEPHSPCLRILSEIIHKSSGQRRQSFPCLASSDSVKGNWKGVNFTFVYVSAIGKHSNKPVEKIGIQAA